MKKILIVTIMLLLLSLTSCGKKDEELMQNENVEQIQVENQEEVTASPDVMGDNLPEDSEVASETASGGTSSGETLGEEEEKSDTMGDNLPEDA